MAPLRSPARYGVDNYPPSSPIHHLTECKSPISPVVIAQAQSSAPVSPVACKLNYMEADSPENLCVQDSRSCPPFSEASKFSLHHRVPSSRKSDHHRVALPKFHFSGIPRERLAHNIIDSSTDLKPTPADPRRCPRMMMMSTTNLSTMNSHHLHHQHLRIKSESPLDQVTSNAVDVDCSRQKVMYLEKDASGGITTTNSSNHHQDDDVNTTTTTTTVITKMDTTWEWSDNREAQAGGDTNLRDGGGDRYQNVYYRKVKAEQNLSLHEKAAALQERSPPPLQIQEPTPKLGPAPQYSTIGYAPPQYTSNYHLSSSRGGDTTPPRSPRLTDYNSHDNQNLQLSPDSTENRTSPGDYSLDSEQRTSPSSYISQALVVRRYDDHPSPASSSTAEYCAASTTLTDAKSREVTPTVSTDHFLVPAPPPPPSCTTSQTELPTSEVKNGNLYAVIDKIIIEFDGTTLLCRVCGDRSSGFHYGVHSCEGCKGFFRRSIQQKIQYRQCSKNQQCLVQKTNRNRCQYCRLKKCIEVGMSKDAVRFGRVPKNEKERIRQAMEKASNSSPQPDVGDETLIHSITASHLKSSAVSNENIRDLIREAEQSPKYCNIDPVSNCPMNPYVGSEDFHQKFSPIVREVVGFAKNIPGFIDVKHDDKITLLRACVFEVLLIRFSSLIDPKNKRMITITGFIINASIYANYKASNDFVNTLFTFVNRINSLNLSNEEMALFTAAIVINPKRQSLTDINKISMIHKRIVHCLHLVMQRERPTNPSLCQELIGTLNDLWILNGMHSKQTQNKHKWNDAGDNTMEGTMNRQHSEMSNKKVSGYTEYSDISSCPARYRSSSEYEDKRMTVDDNSPTSPTSTFTPDEEMRSPGSADSGCSTDSGCSIESNCSSDSGCILNSHANEHAVRTYGLHSEEHREVMCSPEEETAEGLRKCHIKRKPLIVDESKMETEKNRLVSWHKPQKESEKPAADSPVLRMCLEAPSTLKMDGFSNVFYPGAHPHKKFRPALDRVTHSHETLDSRNTSPRPSTTPSPSYSCSPSPSSSISSSPSTISSSPYSSSLSSNPSSPANCNSILAHRLGMPMKRFNKPTSLLQSLTQDTIKVGTEKDIMVCDTLHNLIMTDHVRIPSSQRQHLLGEPSPSRYDEIRNSSPMHQQSMNMSPPSCMTTSPPPSHNNSPPHNYSSPPLAACHIPPAHSPPNIITPTGLGASAMGGVRYSPPQYSCIDSEPLNLSTKTPSPPPIMES